MSERATQGRESSPGITASDERHPERAVGSDRREAPVSALSPAQAQFTRLAGVALAEMGVRLASDRLLAPIVAVIAELSDGRFAREAEEGSSDDR